MAAEACFPPRAGRLLSLGAAAIGIVFGILPLSWVRVPRRRESISLAFRVERALELLRIELCAMMQQVGAATVKHLVRAMVRRA